MVYGSKNNVEREDEKEKVVIPAMVNVEKSERTVNKLLGWSERGEIGIKPLNVLLYDHHPDDR
jgi:hypothetical protein